jgi:membrane-associated protein
MMSFADISSPEQLAALLAGRSGIAYTVLFLGAFLETLIPFSLLIPGEIFFLSGAMLAGMGALDLPAVIGVLYGGGIFGDNISYWLGRYYGTALFSHIACWPLLGRVAHRENYRRGYNFFRKHGAVAVFTARLSGPLSWVTPAMAGVFRLKYGTFLYCNTPGIIIGIGQFIVAGYFFGGHISQILVGIDALAINIALIFCLGTGLFCLYRFISPRQV